jgi:hypothetical protein
MIAYYFLQEENGLPLFVLLESSNEVRKDMAEAVLTVVDQFLEIALASFIRVGLEIIRVEDVYCSKRHVGEESRTRTQPHTKKCWIIT